MKTIVAGSRSIYWKEFIDICLERITKPSVVYCGKAKGMDRAGEDWAKDNCVPVKYYPAMWDSPSGYNNKAGMERNVQMASEADQLVLLYDGVSSGSTHMLKEAIHTGLATTAAILRYKIDPITKQQLLHPSNLIWLNKYVTNDVVWFNKTNELNGFYSNMCKGYSFELAGELIHSSEHLYQTLKFSDVGIQREILNTKNPYEAKQLVNKHKNLINPNLVQVRDAVMVLVTGLKIALSTDFYNKHFENNPTNKTIVEFSNKDPYWGAIPNQTKDQLVGFNRLGYILNLQFDVYRKTGEPLIPMNLPLKFLGEPISHILENCHVNHI